MARYGGTTHAARQQQNRAEAQAAQGPKTLLASASGRAADLASGEDSTGGASPFNWASNEQNMGLLTR